MAITMHKVLTKLGYQKEINAYRGPKGEFIWYRYDRNGKAVRHLFVGKTEVTMYGSSTDVFLTKMTVEEFMELAA